jgi:hypothetical protein
MISFFNFEILDSDNKKNKFNIKRTKEIEYFSKHNPKYQSHCFVNKTHFPHFITDSKDIILQNIKLMINNNQ